MNWLRVLVLFVIAAGVAGASISIYVYVTSISSGAPTRSVMKIEKPSRTNWRTSHDRRFGELSHEELDKAKDQVVDKQLWTIDGTLTEIAADNPRLSSYVGVERQDYQKTFFDGFLQRTSSTPQAAGCRRVVEEWFPRREGDYPMEAHISLLNDCLEWTAGLDDPMRELWAADLACRENLDERTRQQFIAAVEVIEETADSAYWAMHFGAIAVAFAEGDSEQGKLRDELLDRVADFLAEASQHPDGLRFVFQEVAARFFAMPLDCRLTLVGVLAERGDINPWLVHYISGWVFSEKAWEQRGTKTVGRSAPHELRSFHEFQNLASLHFKSAVIERPDIPLAAWKMIMISGSIGDSWTPRHWFLLTVQSQFNLMEAYQSYMHTLKPEWGGGIDEMIEFAKECGSCGAFLSGVPTLTHEYLHLAARRAFRVTESVPEARAQVYDDETRTFISELNQHFEEFVEAGGEIPDDIRREWYAGQALTAFTMLDYETLQTAVPAAGDRLEPAFHLYAQPGLRASMAAACGSEGQGEKIVDVDYLITDATPSSELVPKWSEALQVMEAVETKVTDRGRRYVSYCKTRLQRKIDFFTDQWVDLTFNQQMDGWWVKADVTVTSEDEVRLASSSAGYFPTILFDENLSLPIQVNATIEVEETGSTDAIAGITIGAFRKFTTSGHRAGRMVGIIDRGRPLLAAYHGDPNIFALPLKRESSRATLRVRVYADRYVATIDGQPVVLQETKEFAGDDAFSLGGAPDQTGQGTVVISNVRIHRLPKTPWSEDYSKEQQQELLLAYQRIDPDDPWVKLRLTLLKTGQPIPPSAVGMKSSGNPQERIAIPHLLAQVHQAERDKDVGKAISIYEELIKLDPGQFAFVQRLAWLYAATTDDELRNPEKALNLIESVIEKQGDDWYSQLVVAAASSNMNDFEAAKSAMAEALKTVPEERRAFCEAAAASVNRKEPIRDTPSPSGNEADESGE